MSRGKLDPGVLSPRDHAKIEDNIRREVLRERQFPSPSFEGECGRGDGGNIEVRGKLRLCGRERELSFRLENREDRLWGRIPLRPSDWGIAPFKALAGAIKLQDRIVIELDLDPLPPE